MILPTKSRSTSRRLRVRWADFAWAPSIRTATATHPESCFDICAGPVRALGAEVRRGAVVRPPKWDFTRRGATAFACPVKRADSRGAGSKPRAGLAPQRGSRRGARGFTLVEMLVVIAIIGILAGMLLPALTGGKIKAQKVQAQAEMSGIMSAINQYEATYGRMPISTAAQAALSVVATSSGPQVWPDFTYGTMNFGTNLWNKKSQALPTIQNDGLGYQASNAELMAILLDLATYPDGVTPTVNANHGKNPQHTPFLNARMVGNTIDAGVGSDLVYRDPFGCPYIITLDMNGDNKCRDAFYRLKAVSQVPAGPGQPTANGTGYNGLYNNDPAGTIGDHFEYNGTVMIWSLGPDNLVSLTNAIIVPNKDNVLSWKN